LPVPPPIRMRESARARETETERETERETDRETQTGRHRGRHRQGDTDREIKELVSHMLLMCWMTSGCERSKSAPFLASLVLLVLLLILIPSRTFG